MFYSIGMITLSVGVVLLFLNVVNSDFFGDYEYIGFFVAAVGLFILGSLDVYQGLMAQGSIMILLGLIDFGLGVIRYWFEDF